MMPQNTFLMKIFSISRKLSVALNNNDKQKTKYQVPQLEVIWTLIKRNDGSKSLGGLLPKANGTIK